VLEEAALVSHGKRHTNGKIADIMYLEGVR
jgi:hypothetical protein